MTHSKHTPAPWKFRLDTGDIENNEANIIGGVANSENIDYPTAKANGMLQAAAPELLEALEAVVIHCEGNMSLRGLGVHEAIAKAKGEV